MKRIRENKYFNLGMLLLVVASISILLLAVVLNLDKVGKLLSTVWNAFSPIVIGGVLAYLLNPLMNFMDRRLYPFLCKRKMKEEKARKLSRVASLLFALLVFAILVYEFFALLLPQLYESIIGIVNNFSNYYAVAEKWVMSFLEGDAVLQTWANDMMDRLFVFLENWLESGLVPSLEKILSGLTSSVVSVVGGALDLIIGLCAAVYMLWSRDLFLAQSKKLVAALCKAPVADHILTLGRRIHKVFSGFIIGKLVDSLIIGVMCYIGMLILRLPYPALVATVVGVTNIIPFFGPFIGAIPSAFLILLVNPLQALYFVIFVLVLQQVDGNIIGPRILGDTIGISGFWVLVSITVAGSLFGFAGMVLGVPVFAVLYMLISDFVKSRLEAKGMPADTKAYQTLQSVQELKDGQET